MRRKLTILTAMLLASTGAAFVAAPSTAEQASHLDGRLYVMPGGFVVDLDSGQTLMMSVAMVFSNESEREWLTGIEQDRVRDVVHRAAASVPARRVVSAQGRRALTSRALSRLVLPPELDGAVYVFRRAEIS